MSIDLDLRCHILLFAIPNAVDLSVLIGMGGWMCPNSSKVVLKIMASWPLTKRAPISASAADAITFFMMAQTTCKGPFEGGVFDWRFFLVW